MQALPLNPPLDQLIFHLLKHKGGNSVATAQRQEIPLN